MQKESVMNTILYKPEPVKILHYIIALLFCVVLFGTIKLIVNIIVLKQ